MLFKGMVGYGYRRVKEERWQGSVNRRGVRVFVMRVGLEAKGGGGLRVLTTQEQARAGKSKSKGATMATTKWKGIRGGQRWAMERVEIRSGTGEGTNGELAWKGHAMNQFL